MQDPLGLFPDNAGIAVPIVLMPAGRFVNTDNMIRFDGVGGSVIDTRRVNTCVAPDFACGFNLRIPPIYTADPVCHLEVANKNGGAWSFIDFAHPSCTGRGGGTSTPAGGGFYVAAWQGDGPRGTDNFGFFEVSEATAYPTLDGFKNDVLQRNAVNSFGLGKLNWYVTASKTMLTFTLPRDADKKGEPLAWPFATFGSAELDKLGLDIRKWPLASGEVLSSEGHPGLVRFKNLATGSKVVMDFRDVGEPREVLVDPAADQAADAPAVDGGVASAVPSSMSVDSGEDCGSVEIGGPAVQPMVVAGTPPAMHGGVIRPGTYALTGYASYGDAGASADRGTTRVTLLIAGSMLTYAAAFGAEDGGLGFGERGTQSFKTNGSVLELVARCGTPLAERAAYSVAPDVSGQMVIQLLLGRTLLTFTQR